MMTRGVGPIALALLFACATHPLHDVQTQQSAAPAATERESPISRFADELTRAVDGPSAYWLVASSVDALTSRLAMLDSARVSLDIQYFIWEDDASGRLLLERLVKAADRGVRVRLLIDDVSVFKQDRRHAALSKHPNIEMRTFNPWRARLRITRAAEFLLRAGTLNHRLHNKTIIADGSMALLGGRNIGDRYFGIYDVFVQNDLDILFVGPAVESAADNFKEFWSSGLSIPIDALLKERRKGMTLADLRAELESPLPEYAELLSSFPVARTEWGRWFDAHGRGYSSGPGRFIQDLADVPEESSHQLAAELKDYLASAQTEIVLSTAYLIPDDELLAALVNTAERGARVVLLTNSIQSNNHMLAHVAYKRSRRDLLRAGIELYELRPDAALLERYAVPPVEPGFMGLHTKAAVVDGSFAFVGTPNLDPRSLEFNAESGLIIESSELAQELRTLILEATQERNAWHLQLDERDELSWTSVEGTSTRQPAKGPGQRIMEFIYTLMPIKNQA